VPERNPPSPKAYTPTTSTSSSAFFSKGAPSAVFDPGSPYATDPSEFYFYPPCHFLSPIEYSRTQAHLSSLHRLSLRGCRPPTDLSTSLRHSCSPGLAAPSFREAPRRRFLNTGSRCKPLPRRIWRPSIPSCSLYAPPLLHILDAHLNDVRSSAGCAWGPSTARPFSLSFFALFFSSTRTRQLSGSRRRRFSHANRSCLKTCLDPGSFPLVAEVDSPSSFPAATPSTRSSNRPRSPRGL